MPQMPDSQSPITKAANVPSPDEENLKQQLKLLRDYDLESEIEVWLANHFSDLKLGAALIGSQIDLEGNKRMDMLAIHKTGQLCIVELKRDEAEREVFAQILDYARLLSGFLKADLDDICRKLRAMSLADLFQQAFNRALPKTWPANPQLVIIAQDFDEAQVHMASFLKEHRFDIRLFRYWPENEDGVRCFRFERVDISRKEFRVTGKMPDCTVVVRMAETGKELWSDCKQLEHVPVPRPDALTLRDYLKAGPVSLLVYLNNFGYVASGVVDSKAMTDEPQGDDELIRLRVQWEIAVEFEQAVFRWREDQPPAGKMIRLGVADRDNWARLLGLLRFRAAKTNRNRTPARRKKAKSRK